MQPEALDTRRWWALVVILAATFMASLDTFIVNVAIPSIQRSLQSTFAQVELVNVGYTLAYAVLLVTGGRLGDLVGRKRMFQIGVLSFTLTSLFCGLAPSANVLITLRVLQGVAAAIMVPQVVALIQVTFPAKERGIALGFYGATIGLASIAGQIVGGLLISSNIFDLGWRSVFVVNVPVGLLTLIATFPLIRKAKRDNVRRLDLVGVVILIGGLLLLTYPLIEGHDIGWPFWIFLCILLSLPILALFILYERALIHRHGSPLVPLTLFQHRNFSIGIVAALAFYSGNGAFFFILTLYLQFGLRFSALNAGLTFLPLGIAFFAGSLIAPRIMPFLGTWVLRGGAIIMGVGELWTLLTVEQAGMVTSQSHLMLPLLVIGLGEGIIAAPLINVVLAGMQSKDARAVSGILSTVTQISFALGIGAVGVIFFEVLGQPAQRHTLQLAHAYGQAFVAALFAIIALAVATLVCVSLLPSPKPGQRETATPTFRNSSQGKSSASSAKVR